MLKSYEIEGRFPAYREEVPPAAVRYLASLVKVDPALFAKYPWKGRSIEYHRAQVRRVYGTRGPTDDDEERWLADEICPTETNRERLAAALRRRCRSEKVEPPSTGQVERVVAAGCIRVFAGKKSGRNTERVELRKALDYLRPGDTLVVESLDRLGRSLQDLIAIVSGLRKAGVGFRSLKEAIDTTTPGGRLVFHVFAALAEFIRELIVEGTLEGLDAARARGQRLGRPLAMTPEQVGHARALLTQPDASIASIARLLGVSRSTLYRYVPELKTGGGDIQAIEPVTEKPGA
jgi:DNA invertase Pin-like site-specific DNA recombinase